MVKKMTTEEANIELNKRLDNSHIPVSLDGKMTVSEANDGIQEDFYEDNPRSSVAPSYIASETAAVKITGNDE